MSQMKTRWDRLIPFGQVAAEILRYSYDLDLVEMVEYLRFCLVVDLPFDCILKFILSLLVYLCNKPGLDIYFNFQ